MKKAPNVRRVPALIERKGIPVHIIGGPPRAKVRRVRDKQPPAPRRLPD